MDTIIIYLLKSSLSLAFFYILYMLCFRKDTFFGLRRFYFLASILFSLLFPLFSFQVSRARLSLLPEYFSDTITVVSGNAIDNPGQSAFDFGWMEFSFLIISFVSFILLLRFIRQIYSLYKLRKNNTAEPYGAYTLIRINDPKASSFTFFKWIFLHVGEKSHEDISEILTHEKVYVNQLHTIDVVVCELFCVVFWWNPFAWLLRKELKTNLEYLADRGVLKKGYDSRGYQYTLLHITAQQSGIPIINHFNISELKKRIWMMNKKKSSAIVSVKYLLAIPLVGILLLTNCTTELNTQIEQLSRSNGANILFKPFTTVEQMPQFVGGEEAMNQYIRKNLQYPLDAQENGVEGRVTIRFIVTHEGKIRDAKLLKGILPSCDEEALRVIREMPDWQPGKQNGQPVDVYFTIPIVFKLK
ncbi:M56 family metallopeptidase [Dysgonomonas sp. 25]|uniref:M56 family metallopeptidase n=1 Tax=Dysgonomonas sp. 25 TaxID=2302933 RepID=UPI0013D164A2|nr:M56 family metallopeptidase [Dysgonomonas sp. 25]